MTGERIITNDPSDLKVALMLERLSERMEWMREENVERKRQNDLTQETLREVRDAVLSLQPTMEQLAKDVEATTALGERISIVEREMSDNRSGLKFWLRIYDRIVIWVLAAMATAATAGAFASHLPGVRP